MKLTRQAKDILATRISRALRDEEWRRRDEYDKMKKENKKLVALEEKISALVKQRDALQEAILKECNSKYKYPIGGSRDYYKIKDEFFLKLELQDDYSQALELLNSIEKEIKQ